MSYKPNFDRVKRLYTLLLVFCAVYCRSQYRDTLHEIFTHKSSMDARLESRYGLISNELSVVTGFRVGVAFQRKLRIGGGLSWLKSDYQRVFYTTGESGLPVGSSIRFFKFAYLCFYLDFVFHKTKRWQLSVPIQAGSGIAWYQREADINVFGGDRKYGFVLYEPGITVQFKVFKWLGLGSDVAYRFMLKNKKIGEKLYSPTYSFKLLVFFDQLFYELFPDSRITQKRGPAAW